MSLKIPKLSKRLTAIFNFVDETQDFYDLCCDHGKLGVAVYESGKSKNVHFVDPVEKLINQIRSAYPNENAFFYQQDARKIYVRPKSTLSIAGVGIHLGLDILKTLSVDESLCFILNLNGISLYVRKFLIENNFFLLDEHLVFEKNQFYEVLKVSLSRGEEVSVLGGKKIWDQSSISQSYCDQLKEYLMVKLNHSNDNYLKLCLEELKNKRN